ncbi:RIP metalloprotease RseP [Aggregatilinea lenta]|uniref:RIP metalloprotease RseP n=1 Tax=Aggregatilinea lenta TaxID=913108 RepID=UPI000E5BC5E1|nr:RIP metalloprotease RseP [Aggregatilinea lenta]
MDSFVLGIASFMLVLIPLVIIHEFGHFIAAKLSGITVLEFGIGFPPRAAVLFRKGDTIYTLNWLPIGGFVRPFGEDMVKPKTEAELSTDRQEIKERGIKNPKSVNEAGPWQRMFFMAAGPGINFLTALLLFIVVALVGQPYARADIAVYDLIPGSPADDAGLQQGDIIETVNGDHLDSAADFNDWIADHQGEQMTLQIQRGDEQFDVTMTADASLSTDGERAYITGLTEGMPAYDAGLQIEDLIIAVDDIQITSIGQLQRYTQDHEGDEIQVTVLRGDEQLTVPVTPREDSDGVVRIGIEIAGLKPAAVGLTAVNRDTETYTRALPVGEALRTGFDQFTSTFELLYDFVHDLFTGDIALSAARPVSPIGIGQLGGPVLEQSLDQNAAYPIVMFAAIISISLAITNLLPIPGLDGGRILFVVIELIRGKPMAPEREGLIHLIGLLLLLGLIAFTVINDIINPIDIGSLK